MKMTSNLSLHKAVFEGDFGRVEQTVKALKNEEINGRDIHGNTALHIAAMKGERRCVELLVKSGAKTTIPNELNWLPLQEAISYGDFQMSKILADNELALAAQYLRKEKLRDIICMGQQDYVLKLEIRRKEYKPTMGPVPKQGEMTMTVFKKGDRARFDLDITDAFHSRPIRIALIFNFTDNSFKFLLKNAPVYQAIPLDEFDQIIANLIKYEILEQMVTEAMKKENVANNLEIDPVHLNQPLFRKTFSKKVGGFATDIYECKGVDLIRKVRTEHLVARQGLTAPTQESLPPPEPRNVTWDQYLNAPKGQFPYLGRKPIETTQSNRISIIIGIAKEISIKFNWSWIVEWSANMMDYKIPEQLADQIKSLPEGFPTLIDLPMHKSTDYVKWKLISFDAVSDLTDELFVVPSGYEPHEIIHIRQSSDNQQTSAATERH